jgi:hypothetical protein
MHPSLSNASIVDHKFLKLKSSCSKIVSVNRSNKARSSLLKEPKIVNILSSDWDFALYREQNCPRPQCGTNCSRKVNMNCISSVVNMAKQRVRIADGHP